MPNNTDFLIGVSTGMILASVGFFFLASHFEQRSNYVLPKSEWECTARDVRDNSCVEYGLIKFPKKVEYKKAID